MPRGQANLQKRLCCESAFGDTNDDMQGLKDSVFHGSCMWQHKAAGHDARVVGEAVANNGRQHRPGGLAGASRWGVVEHLTNGCCKCSRLLGTLGDLARSLGARRV